MSTCSCRISSESITNCYGFDNRNFTLKSGTTPAEVYTVVWVSENLSPLSGTVVIKVVSMLTTGALTLYINGTAGFTYTLNPGQTFAVSINPLDEVSFTATTLAGTDIEVNVSISAS